MLSCVYVKPNIVYIPATFYKELITIFKRAADENRHTHRYKWSTEPNLRTQLFAKHEHHYTSARPDPLYTHKNSHTASEPRTTTIFRLSTVFIPLSRQPPKTTAHLARSRVIVSLSLFSYSSPLSCNPSRNAINQCATKGRTRQLRVFSSTYAHAHYTHSLEGVLKSITHHIIARAHSLLSPLRARERDTAGHGAKRRRAKNEKWFGGCLKFMSDF